MDMFEENERHPMKVETREVTYDNCEIDAAELDFSDRTMLIESALELKEMGAF